MKHSHILVTYSFIAFCALTVSVANAVEIKHTATKTIEISSSQISIDGSVSSIKCPHTEKSSYASFTLGPTSLAVTCAEDYLGGFFAGDEILAQKESDAGDSWDKQSLVFRDIKSKSLIASQITYATFDTSIECEGTPKVTLEKQGWSNQKIKECLGGKISCKKTEKFLRWNEAGHKFEEITFKGKVPNRKFQPFETYRKHCT